MQQMQHLFTQPQQHYPGEWSQGHHQHPNHHVAQHGQLQAQAQAAQAQAQAQAAAAAAAAAQAQQQHYQRIAGNNGTAVPGNGIVPRGPANDMQANTEIGMTEENRRVLDWIAQLMKPATRESALLELSKKREQVPELALILWHSFGTPDVGVAIGDS
jgi:CCR4-NOT transcription complex subunit 9